MRALSPIARVAGHPAIAVPGSVVTIGLCIAALSDAAWWPIAITLLIAMFPVVRLAKAREDYMMWQRQWDGMAGSNPPRRASSGRSPRPWLGGALLALLGLFFATHASDPVYAGALVWLVLAVGIVALVALIRTRLKRQPATRAKDAPVAICISKPLLPVPRLKDAYRALPVHCRVLLGL